MANRQRFGGRAYLVTGASSGIGRASAHRIAADGGSVLLAGRRRDRLEAVRGDIEKAGGKAAIATGDVREEATGPAWVDACTMRFGRLDGLVNAAGVIGSGGLLETDPSEWDRTMDTNLRSIYLLLRAAAPALIERKGAIVNISSVAGLRPYGAIGAYCVSKAGLDMLTRCAALELADRGVRVNAVNPGVVRTELHTVTHAVPDYPAFLERARVTHPLGRWAEPDEIASLVAYLLSDEAGWITGVTYSIDGGRALSSLR